jgi:hypothetical protein
VALRVAGVQLHRAPQAAFGLGPVPPLHLHEGQRAVGLGQAFVQLHGLPGGCFGQRLHVRGRSPALDRAQDGVTHRQSRVRRCVSRVPGQGLPELLDGSACAVLPALGNVLAAAEIGLVDLGVHRARGGQAGPFFGRELDPDLLCDRPRQLSLKSQHVPKVALVAPGPKRAIGPGVAEHGADPHPVAGPEDRPLNHCVHAQLAADLGERRLRALVAQGGRPRDDAQCGDPRQVTDERVHHAVGEVLLLGVPREVLEGQDGDRVNGGGPPPSPQGEPPEPEGQDDESGEADQQAALP